MLSSADSERKNTSSSIRISSWSSRLDVTTSLRVVTSTPCFRERSSKTVSIRLTSPPKGPDAHKMCTSGNSRDEGMTGKATQSLDSKLYSLLPLLGFRYLHCRRRYEGPCFVILWICHTEILAPCFVTPSHLEPGQRRAQDLQKNSVDCAVAQPQ